MISLKEKGILLTNAYEDEIEQEANGKYQLSFKYPTSDDSWTAILPGDLILADDLDGEQEFRIFEVTKRHEYLNIYAEQVADDLNKYSISSINVDRVTGGVVMSNLAGSIVRSHPFSFYSDIDTQHTFNEKNVSAMSALAEGKHSILGQWGGDLVRDKYHISLLKNGGRDSEALFMYQKNLKAYVETDSIKDLVTRLHLSIKDSDVATTVDSPLIDAYNGRIYESSIEVSDQDVQTVEHLQEYGQNYFAENLVDIASNSLEIAVTDNQEYDVRIFDTVFVHHKVFGKDLRMKITSYKYSPMGRKLKSIGFGKTKANLAQQMSSIASDVSEKAVSVSESNFEQKLRKEIENADRVVDGKFEDLKNEVYDGIEQSKAEAELYADNIKQNIDAEIAQVNSSMQAQSEEHDRQVADILSKTQSVEALANQAKTDAANAITTLHNVTDTVDSHTRTIGAVGTSGSILDNVSKVTQTANGLVTEVSGTNGLKTQVSTLAGSYAIKNLTNSGTVLNQLNLNKDGSVKIDGKLVQITGTTYIQDGVISSAKIASLDAGKVTTGYLASARIATNSITGSHIAFDQAFFNSFMANEAYLKQLFAKTAFITQVQAVTLSASNVTTGILRATNGALDIDLDNANITFNKSATINFNSDSNALVRKKGDVTAFVNFADDPISGGVYAGIGVTSHNVGVTTASNSDRGKFAGMRVYRPNDSVDLVRLIGDTVAIAHGTEGNYFNFKPTELRNNVDMIKLAGAVYTLSKIFIHLRVNGWSFSDPSFIQGVKDEMARNWLDDFAIGGLPR